MKNDELERIRAALREIEIGISVAVVLLGLACFLLWRILEALTP